MRSLLTSRLFVAIAAAVVGAASVGAVWAITSGDEKGKAAGELRVEFEPGPRHLADLVQRSGVFEDAIATVSREVNLPRDLTVKVIGDETAAQKEVSGPEYVPEDHTVYFPWSFVAESDSDLESLAKLPPADVDRIANVRHRLTRVEADELLRDALIFVLYHEISHGLFDLLDIPVVGGEEPTADSLAGILAITTRDGGERVTLAGAALDLLRGERSGTPSLAEYADDHGFDQSRAFNALCLVYGSSPAAHPELVGGPGDLTRQRAELCPFEFKSDRRSWQRLLRRWLTDTGGLRPLSDND